MYQWSGLPGPKKAFDTMNHSVLLRKLTSLGICEMSHKWFNSYLRGRTQCTKIKNVCSDEGEIDYGVPQGSILGPLFFILFVNSLPAVLSLSNVYLYVDDTTIAVSRDNIPDMVTCLNQELSRA